MQGTVPRAAGQGPQGFQASCLVVCPSGWHQSECKLGCSVSHSKRTVLAFFCHRLDVGVGFLDVENENAPSCGTRGWSGVQVYTRYRARYQACLGDTLWTLCVNKKLGLRWTAGCPFLRTLLTSLLFRHAPISVNRAQIYNRTMSVFAS